MYCTYMYIHQFKATKKAHMVITDSNISFDILINMIKSYATPLDSHITGRSTLITLIFCSTLFCRCLGIFYTTCTYRFSKQN